MLEAILIPRIRKCTPKSFPTPISQQAKTYWPFILNNVLLLFITQKNISCETMRHVMVWCCAYNVWYDYSLYTNILPRQVLLYLIYHERVHSYCVSRVKVMGAERREAGAEAERERETSSWAQNVLSWAVLCITALHSTVHSWIQGLGSERQRVGQTRDQGLPSELSPDNICCSPLSGPRQVWLSVWQVVTDCDSVTCVT